MEKLQVFQSGLFDAVRATMIDYEPWFVGADVSKALGYATAADAIYDYVDDEDKRFVHGSQFTLANDVNKRPISNRNITIINESGVYSLIFSSKQERAKEFKRWVTHEVLPSLRRTGQYSTGQSRPALTSADYFKALKLIGSARADRLPYLFDTFKEMGLELPEPSALLAHKPGKSFQREYWQRRLNSQKSYKQFRETADEVALALRRAYDHDVSLSVIASRCGVCRSDLYKFMWGDRLLRHEAQRQRVIETANNLTAMAEGKNIEQENMEV